MSKSRLPFLALAVSTAVLGLIGCRSNDKPGDEPPKDLTRFRWADSNPMGSQYLPLERQASQALNNALCVAPFKPEPGRKPLNVLSVSAGGKFAAYVGGQLVGWTERGDRPTFDIATGVSGGIIPAVYGFLGPKYDCTMQRLYLTLQSRDLFRFHPMYYLAKQSTLGSSWPIQEVFEKELTDEIIEELAHAYRDGRRCMISTMNLHTRRIAIWDITALAASNRPDKKCLIVKIMVAGCSIPGFVEPVEFDVTVDGCRYKEMHCDGGAVCQAFMRLTIEQTAEGRIPVPEGSRLFCMACGKLYVDPLQGKLSMIDKIRSATTGTQYALFRGDVYRMYTVSIASGLKFHLSALDPEFQIKPESMKIEKDDLQRLFLHGLEEGRKGVKWRNTPPGAEFNEEEYPRTSTDYKLDNTTPGALMPIPEVPNSQIPKMLPQGK